MSTIEFKEKFIDNENFMYNIDFVNEFADVIVTSIGDKYIVDSHVAQVIDCHAIIYFNSYYNTYMFSLLISKDDVKMSLARYISFNNVCLIHNKVFETINNFNLKF